MARITSFLCVLYLCSFPVQALAAQETALGKLADAEKDAAAYRSDATTRMSDLQARLDESAAANADAMKSMKLQVGNKRSFCPLGWVFLGFSCSSITVFCVPCVHGS